MTYSIVIFSQRASETARLHFHCCRPRPLATAQTRIHTLSDSMLVELQKLQTSSTEFSASLQNTLHSSAAHIQSQIPQIQQSYADLTAAISATVGELSAIITTKDLPVQDKVTRVSKEVQDRVQPLLESVKKGVSEVLARSRGGGGQGSRDRERSGERQRARTRNRLLLSAPLSNLFAPFFPFLFLRPLSSFSRGFLFELVPYITIHSRVLLDAIPIIDCTTLSIDDHSLLPYDLQYITYIHI